MKGSVAANDDGRKAGVKARIEASLAKGDAELEKLGRELGREWAEKRASGVVLRRIANAIQAVVEDLGPRAHWKAIWAELLGDDQHAGYRLAEIAEPDGKAWEGFWSGALGADREGLCSEAAFVYAFADEAADVFTEATLEAL